MERKDKVAGSIFGLMIGDIMAHPFKNLPFEERKQYFPVKDFVEPFDVEKLFEIEHAKINDLRMKVQNWFPAGFYSFYTQQTLLVLDSVISKQDVDIEDISQRLVKYSYPRDRTSPFGIYRGYTRQFYDSIQNIVNGLPLKVCGVTHCIGDSPFKSVPLALFYASDVRELSNKSLDLCLLTNRDVTSVGGAAAIAYTISQASTKTYFNVDEELHRIIDFTRNAENFAVKRYTDFLSDSISRKNLVSESLNELYTLKDKPIEEGVRFFNEFASNHKLQSNSAVVTTGLSLLLFIKNIGSFELCVKNALELDANIEIITPLAASISGSLLGVERIPKYWKKLIIGRKDLLAKMEYLKAEGEKPLFKNYFIREIEFSDQLFEKKNAAYEKLDDFFSNQKVKVTN